MKNLNDLKKSINDSIEKVLKISRVETENFSTQQLKDEVIPILKDAEKRILDIESITNNIDGIRNEIIMPVNATIKEKSKQSNLLAYIGIFSGLIGVTFTLYSFLSQEISLSDKTLNDIKIINAILVDEQVDLKVRDLNRLKEQIKYEQKILLTSKTRFGTKSLAEYSNYLVEVGYKNVQTISWDSIVSGAAGIEIRRSFYRPFNTIPYIYYRTPNINSDLLLGIEHISKYYSSSSEYGQIIGVMNFQLSTDRYINWTFNKYGEIELLIVL